MSSSRTLSTSPRTVLEPTAAASPAAVGIHAASGHAAADDELTDAELETVLGGLARSYVVPVAPLSRRTI